MRLCFPGPLSASLPPPPERQASRNWVTIYQLFQDEYVSVVLFLSEADSNSSTSLHAEDHRGRRSRLSAGSSPVWALSPAPGSW